MSIDLNSSKNELLIIIGGIIALIGLFLTGVTVDAVLGESYSVLDLLLGKHGDIGGGFISGGAGFMSYLPFISVLLGIIAAILGILMLVNGSDMKKIVLIVSAIGLIIAVVFLLAGCNEYLWSGNLKEYVKLSIDSGIVKISAGIGVFLALIGNLVALIGAAVKLP